MGKALFFNIPATGHINPSLNVVRELIQRGEQVVYVDAEETRALIESSGARFVSYPAETACRSRIAPTSTGFHEKAVKLFLKFISHFSSRQ